MNEDYDGSSGPCRAGWIISGMIWWGAMLALLCWAVWYLLPGLIVREALAHDAPISVAQPGGWSYPFACCSGYDCRPVGEGRMSKAPVSVQETAEGYRISTTGEVIAYSDTRIRNSKDQDFHWCSVAGTDDGRTICLFVPPRAF